MDMKKIALIGNIAKVIIGLIGFFLFIQILSAPVCEAEYNKVCPETIPFISGSISLSMAALVICGGLALLFGIVFFFQNIRKSVGAIIGLIGLLVLAGISYAMSTGDLTSKWSEAGVTEQVSHLSGAGVYLVMFLLGITVVAALLSEVTRFFK
jgi:xanthosine utilization system XapX-like protein